MRAQHPLFLVLYVHWRSIQNWVVDFESNDGRLSESVKGKWRRRWILDEVDLKNKAIYFLKGLQKDMF